MVEEGRRKMEVRRRLLNDFVCLCPPVTRWALRLVPNHLTLMIILFSSVPESVPNLTAYYLL